MGGNDRSHGGATPISPSDSAGFPSFSQIATEAKLVEREALPTVRRQLEYSGTSYAASLEEGDFGGLSFFEAQVQARRIESAIGQASKIELPSMPSIRAGAPARSSDEKALLEFAKEQESATGANPAETPKQSGGFKFPQFHFGSKTAGAQQAAQGQKSFTPLPQQGVQPQSPISYSPQGAQRPSASAPPQQNQPLSAQQASAPQEPSPSSAMPQSSAQPTSRGASAAPPSIPQPAVQFKISYGSKGKPQASVATPPTPAPSTDSGIGSVGEEAPPAQPPASRAPAYMPAQSSVQEQIRRYKPVSPSGETTAQLQAKPSALPPKKPIMESEGGAPLIRPMSQAEEETSVSTHEDENAQAATESIGEEAAVADEDRPAELEKPPELEAGETPAQRIIRKFRSMPDISSPVQEEEKMQAQEQEEASGQGVAEEESAETEAEAQGEPPEAPGEGEAAEAPEAPEAPGEGEAAEAPEAQEAAEKEAKPAASSLRSVGAKKGATAKSAPALPQQKSHAAVQVKKAAAAKAKAAAEKSSIAKPAAKPKKAANSKKGGAAQIGPAKEAPSEAIEENAEEAESETAPEGEPGEILIKPSPQKTSAPQKKKPAEKTTSAKAKPLAGKAASAKPAAAKAQPEETGRQEIPSPIDAPAMPAQKAAPAAPMKKAAAKTKAPSPAQASKKIQPAEPEAKGDDDSDDGDGGSGGGAAVPAAKPMQKKPPQQSAEPASAETAAASSRHPLPPGAKRVFPAKGKLAAKPPEAQDEESQISSPQESDADLSPVRVGGRVFPGKKAAPAQIEVAEEIAKGVKERAKNIFPKEMAGAAKKKIPPAMAEPEENVRPEETEAPEAQPEEAEDSEAGHEAPEETEDSEAGHGEAEAKEAAKEKPEEDNAPETSAGAAQPEMPAAQKQPLPAASASQKISKPISPPLPPGKTAAKQPVQSTAVPPQSAQRVYPPEAPSAARNDSAPPPAPSVQSRVSSVSAPVLGAPPQSAEKAEGTAAIADEIFFAYAREKARWLYDIYKMGGMSLDEFRSQVREKMSGERPDAPKEDALANSALQKLNKEIEKKKFRK